ncbi:MAG: Holliday junction resolvase Hjc [Candidatus Bathyarchaeia archaeon]
MKRKGYRAERELVKKLRSWGFKSVRAPVSAPSSEPLPDVFATKGDRILAFEIKAPNSDRAYFRKKQVKKLFDFLSMFEAYAQRTAIIGTKFPYKWVFREIKAVDDYVVLREEKGNITFE